MNVTVVINNRNLFSWPKSMVEKILKYENLAEIIIIDNESTYEPLLEWYSQIQHKIIRIPNLGHSAPWIPEINALIKTDLYVVSDPDLDLELTPNDTLRYLVDCLNKYPEFEKIGLGLDILSVPKDAPLYSHVNSHEKYFWDLPLIDGVLRKAPVDTTFAVYSKKIMNSYKITGARADYPYVAKHIPWNIVDRSEEFNYYIKTANNSSCYKTYLKL
jgi:hypothetical protein